MNQINESTRLREANKEKAEGEKILLVKAAEADCDAKKLSGEGVAKQRKAIVDGASPRSPPLTSSSTGCRNQLAQVWCPGSPPVAAAWALQVSATPFLTSLGARRAWRALPRRTSSTSSFSRSACPQTPLPPTHFGDTLGPPFFNFDSPVVFRGQPPEVLVLHRYFDMLKDIGSHPGTSTVFLPSDKAPVRDGMLQANAMAR